MCLKGLGEGSLRHSWVSFTWKLTLSLDVRHRSGLEFAQDALSVYRACWRRGEAGLCRVAGRIAGSHLALVSPCSGLCGDKASTLYQGLRFFLLIPVRGRVPAVGHARPLTHRERKEPACRTEARTCLLNPTLPILEMKCPSKIQHLISKMLTNSSMMANITGDNLRGPGTLYTPQLDVKIKALHRDVPF